MKRIMIGIMMAAMMAGSSYAEDVQTSKVKVILKNGTVLTGEMVDFNPTTAITIRVGGRNTAINMSDVQSIEDSDKSDEPVRKENVPAQPRQQAQPQEKPQVQPQPQEKITPSKPVIVEKNSKKAKKAEPTVSTQADPVDIDINNVEEILHYLGDDPEALYVTDTASYPDSIKISVGGQDLTMVLIRGGIYNMGHTGRKDFKADPMHKVRLSSFYVSKEQLLNSTVRALTGKETKHPERRFNGKFKDADKAVKAAAESLGKPYRMITEAEWEYIAKQPFAWTVFTPDDESANWYRTNWKTLKQSDYCSDFMGDYKNRLQTNPKGPAKGTYHVVRTFPGFNDKMKLSRTALENTNASVRLAISADEI